MCGHDYAPDENIGCEKCPFNSGCLLACCPVCGYEAPDPAQSKLVGFAGRLRSRVERGRARRRRGHAVDGLVPLSEIRPGCRVRIDGFGDLPEGWNERLQAYGLSPGRDVEVVQQNPVTLVRIEHIDLAFEDSVARQIATVPAD
jgi:Fe2+ transport system protein FeoA